MKGQGFIGHFLQQFLRLGTAEKLGPALFRIHFSQKNAGNSILFLWRQCRGSFESLLKKLGHLSDASLRRENSARSSPSFKNYAHIIQHATHMHGYVSRWAHAHASDSPSRGDLNKKIT